jgi:hypothetical protein
LHHYEAREQILCPELVQMLLGLKIHLPKTIIF